ncbi:MAG TPA: NADP-dependent oxidoreductase [Acidimicrobiales bacterium]|nr:NADP-dependent oxidoreductase [Acidimicrobiales bacterium]
MRAAVVPIHGPAQVIEIRDDWPAPEPPGEGEVLIAVKAAGLNPSDTKIRARSGSGAPGAKEPPYVAGREAAGTIIECGPGVEELGPGDEVFAFFGWFARPGGHAQRLVVSASMVARRPPDVPVEEAAAVPLAGLTALQGLRLLGVPAGERLLVTAGAGGVGHFAVQLGARYGLEVVATAGPANHQFVRALGASEVVDYHDPGVTDRLGGISYVLDAVGGDNIDSYQNVLAQGARVVAIAGLPSKIRGDITATAIRCQPSADDLTELARLQTEGDLRPSVQDVFPLARSADAHLLLEGGHVRGKLVIQVEAG